MCSDFWSKNTIAAELGVGWWRVAYAINKAGIEPDIVVPAGSLYGREGRNAIVGDHGDWRMPDPLAARDPLE